MRHSEGKPAPELITSEEGLKAAVSVLQKEAVIGVDTKFIRETSFYPRIALIQLASHDQTFLVDPTAFEQKELGVLLDLLSDITDCP